MSEPNPATTNQDEFDRILANRVEIAELVNSFDSERVQRKAFDALVWSLGLSGEADEQSSVEPTRLVRDVPDDAPNQKPTVVSDQQSNAEETGNGTPKKRSRGGAKKTYTVPRGLNFAPEGHPSLEQFVAEKQPRTNDEKFLVACYYLSNMVGIEDVEIGHTLAVYQAAEWSAPAHPDSALRGCAHRTGWIDTANTKAIKVVWKGENYLTTKMPGEPKKTG